MATFKGFWHGPQLGLLRIACLNSFLNKGHRFQLYTYQKFDHMPGGIEIIDANTIYPQSSILWHDNYENNSCDLGPFSDLFRLKLLHNYGGWWCDVDTMCLRSDIPDQGESWSQEFSAIEAQRSKNSLTSYYLNSNIVANGQVRLLKESRLATELYNRAKDIIDEPLEKRESMGPNLWTQVIEDLGLPKSLNGSPNLFYPIKWLEAFKLWLPEFRDEVISRSMNSYFIPIYQSSALHADIDLQRLPPKGSYLYEFLVDNKGTHSLTDIPILDHKEVRNKFKRYFENNSDWMYPYLEDFCGPQVFKALGLRSRPKDSFRLKVKRVIKRTISPIYAFAGLRSA